MDLCLDAVQDCDFENAIQAIKDVKHYASAAPLKANKGLKRKVNRVDELQTAKESLDEAMARLMASPYTQSQPKTGPLVRDKTSIAALRSLWAVLHEFKRNAGQKALSEAAEAQLSAAMQRAVKALDPGHTFLAEEGREGEDVASKEPARKSNRLATKERKDYNEKNYDDDLAELIGDLEVEEGENVEAM